MFLFYSQSGSTVAIGDLDFCLRFTVACARLSVSVDERKKRTRSERSTRAAKTRSLSLPTSHAVFCTFFRSVFPTILGLQLLRAFCERKIALIVLFCYSIGDLCEFSYTILGQICRFYDHTIRIPSIDSAGYCDDIKILMM